VLYLLGMRQVDGNANFKNDFSYFTDVKGLFYY